MTATITNTITNPVRDTHTGHQTNHRTETPDDVRLDVRPLTPVIGAEIYGVDLRQTLDTETIGEIKAAINRWKVIFFRNQDITDEQFLKFGRYFGPLTPAHPVAEELPEHPEIWERKAAEYRERRADPYIPSTRPPRDYKGWHIDITFVANPNKYSILRGVEIPAYGGDTLWSNLALAYEGLSPKIQTLIDDLQAVHGVTNFDVNSAQGSKPRKGPFVALHPLVRVHPETGEKVLFLNPGVTSHIVGLKANESQALLELLSDEVTRPEYQVRFHWTPNAIALWDNQATAHAGPIDYVHFHAPASCGALRLRANCRKGRTASAPGPWKANYSVLSADRGKSS